MLGLWASFAVFLTFMTAVLVENLDEQPTTSSEETRRVLEIVPPRSHDARTDARIGGDIVKVG
jgi:hypothetical protein